MARARAAQLRSWYLHRQASVLCYRLERGRADLGVLRERRARLRGRHA